jgi:hypothetical protein
MLRPIHLPAKRRRGNPNWGKAPQSLPALLTEFEMHVERLQLRKAEYVASADPEPAPWDIGQPWCLWRQKERWNIALEQVRSLAVN